jgi:hypothetical protein
MHGECQLFSPTLLVEVERSLLKIWVALYTLVRVCRRGARWVALYALAGACMTWRWAQAHDVRVNAPPKSGLKPRRSAASFCHLFLL